MKRLWLILFVIIGCASNQYTERDIPNIVGWQKGLPRREDVKLYLVNGSEWSGVISEYNSSERNMEFYVMQVDGKKVQQEMIELNYDKVTKIAHYTDKGIEIIEPKDFDSYRWYIKSEDTHDVYVRGNSTKKERNKAAFDALMRIAIDKTSDESGNQQSSNKRTCQYDGTKLVYTLDTKMDWSSGMKIVRLWKCEYLPKHEYWIVETEPPGILKY